MLKTALRPFKSRILYVNDPSSAGQLRVVVFGANSQISPSLAYFFSRLSSQVTFPTRTSYKWVDNLKCCGHYKNVIIKHLINYEDPQIFDKLIYNANVVINLIGAVHYIRDYDNIYDGNVTIPKRIAEAVARNPDVIRFIHFSAAGADPHSTSSRLSTKWLGQQEVKRAFPQVTIFRPTQIFGILDNFALKYALLDSMLGYVPIVGDGDQKRQPIFSNDLGQCVINALKIPESAGKTYELGGPHVYSLKDILEMIYHKIQKPPKIRSMPFEQAHRWLQWMPHFQALNRHISLNQLHESKLDIVVGKDALKIEDLYVQPVSMPQNLMRILADFQFRPIVTHDERVHGWNGGDDYYFEP